MPDCDEVARHGADDAACSRNRARHEIRPSRHAKAPGLCCPVDRHPGAWDRRQHHVRRGGARHSRAAPALRRSLARRHHQPVVCGRRRSRVFGERPPRLVAAAQNCRDRGRLLPSRGDRPRGRPKHGCAGGAGDRPVLHRARHARRCRPAPVTRLGRGCRRRPARAAPDRDRRYVGHHRRSGVAQRRAACDRRRDAGRLRVPR